MPFNLTVCPDFKTDLISGWYIFNTWLQKQLNESIHLELYQSFEEQHRALDDKKVDIIYANPYDISRLVRDEGFIPIVKPKAKPDEAVIAVKEGSGIESITQLPNKISIAKTDARDVNTIGMIMLEPADVKKDDIIEMHCDNYVAVAKHIINGDANVGFFLSETFNELSSLVRKQLRPLVSSQIHMIHHALLIAPSMANYEADLRGLLVDMHQNDKGKAILKDLEIPQWEPMEMEDAEFMVDLIDTLITDE